MIKIMKDIDKNKKNYGDKEDYQRISLLYKDTKAKFKKFE